MLEAIAKNKQGVLCSFVGTGKSRVKYEVISQVKGHRLLVFPSINLIEQFFKVYAQDAFIISVERPKTPAEIESQFMQEESTILITYQSLNKLAPFFPKLKIVIYDEAHHICTARQIAMLEKLSILQIRRYFFTATPKDTKNLRMMVSSE
jgi:superfamily II DNA or RNA helicase